MGPASVTVLHQRAPLGTPSVTVSTREGFPLILLLNTVLHQRGPPLALCLSQFCTREAPFRTPFVTVLPRARSTKGGPRQNRDKRSAKQGSPWHSVHHSFAPERALFGTPFLTVLHQRGPCSALRLSRFCTREGSAWQSDRHGFARNGFAKNGNKQKTKTTKNTNKQEAQTSKKDKQAKRQAKNTNKECETALTSQY